MGKSKVIAIDGPSGSGKSTIAKNIADTLQLTYLDTGAMFRAIALILDEKLISSADTTGIEECLSKMKFEYQPSDNVLIRINDVDLTHEIREHHVSKLASQYSQVPQIREFLKLKQREIASSKASILEGRDIGTVIFPNAALKVFLTARAEVRAKRRLRELKERSPNENYNLEKILQDIVNRDMSDQNRSVAPLVKADDAVEIDTSEMTISEIVDQIIGLFNQRKKDFY